MQLRVEAGQELSNIVDKTQDLFEFCNIGWAWHLCDGFNFVSIRSHAIRTYDVAKVLYLCFAK